MDSSFQSRARFARAHFAGAELGDRRRSARLVALAELGDRPQGTLPNKIPDPYQLDAAYRFFRTEQVTPDAIQQPHRHHTRVELDRTEDVVLIAHDGTELNFTGLGVPELGVLAGPKQRGFVAHNSLAVTASGRILGLLHQILFTPRNASRKAPKSERRHDPHKASVLWRDALEAIGPAPAGKRWVHVADRGADVTEFRDYAHENRMEYVVRVNHNRNVTVLDEAGEWTVAKLHDTLQCQPALGRRTQEVGTQKGRTGGTATVAVRALTLSLIPPRPPRGRARGVPLLVTAIRVWEVDPPAGEKPLEWLLVTNVPGADVASAWARADWYAKRWRVEEYHKSLKTGLGLEELQLTTKVGLQNALSLLSVVAVGLVMLRELARDPVTAAQPIDGWVQRSWVEVLSQWRHDHGEQLATVKDWVWALARLGGHQNAAQLGPPGWHTLLRGWPQLQAMIDGWEIRGSCGGS
ncbi:IS4 family transposase [Gemmata obscuriglobus]|uniref:IS4 family transposase n=1 Tax=Gemmata obscuriglobus TaxID=114 RepID=UPI0002E90844|nr:IS4 family transposase [Gemmata obscuriglobus]